MNRGFLVTTAIGLLLAGGSAGAQSSPMRAATPSAPRLLLAQDDTGGQGQGPDQNVDDAWDGPGYYLESPQSRASNGTIHLPMKFGGPFTSLDACQQYHQKLKAGFGKEDDEHCIYRGSYVRYAQNPCFLTTACVQHAGLRDDCDELMLMRALRDRYLAKFGEGRAVIARYYEIAPYIVDCIRRTPYAEHILTWILGEVRADAELVAWGDMEAAMLRYTLMVLRLEQHFGASTRRSWCVPEEDASLALRRAELCRPASVASRLSLAALGQGTLA